MTNATRLLVSLTLSAWLCACGQSGTSAPNDTNKLCDAIIVTGLTKQCTASDLSGTIGIVIDTHEEAARNLCPDIANKIKALTADLTGNWRLQIFSPLREDKPLAYCALH